MQGWIVAVSLTLLALAGCLDDEQLHSVPHLTLQEALGRATPMAVAVDSTMRPWGAWSVEIGAWPEGDPSEDGPLGRFLREQPREGPSDGLFQWWLLEFLSADGRTAVTVILNRTASEVLVTGPMGLLDMGGLAPLETDGWDLETILEEGTGNLSAELRRGDVENFTVWIGQGRTSERPVVIATGDSTPGRGNSSSVGGLHIDGRWHDSGAAIDRVLEGQLRLADEIHLPGEGALLLRDEHAFRLQSDHLWLGARIERTPSALPLHMRIVDPQGAVSEAVLPPGQSHGFIETYAAPEGDWRVEIVGAGPLSSYDVVVCTEGHFVTKLGILLHALFFQPWPGCLPVWEQATSWGPPESRAAAPPVADLLMLGQPGGQDGSAPLLWADALAAGAL